MVRNIFIVITVIYVSNNYIYSLFYQKYTVGWKNDHCNHSFLSVNLNSSDYKKQYSITRATNLLISRTHRNRITICITRRKTAIWRKLESWKYSGYSNHFWCLILLRKDTSNFARNRPSVQGFQNKSKRKLNERTNEVASVCREARRARFHLFRFPRTLH